MEEMNNQQKRKDWMQNKDVKCRVEFENLSGKMVEVRYFNPPQDSSFLSWRLPLVVVEEVISWWKRLREKGNMMFPIKEKTEVCEFGMSTTETVRIREVDKFGRYKMIGWNLPKGAVEEMTGWHEKA